MMGEGELVYKSKIPLSRDEFVGGLTKGLVNVVEFNILPEEKELGLCSKVELVIMLERDGLSRGAYRSVRFVNAAQLRRFLFSCIKAYISFGRLRGEIRHSTLDYHLRKILKFVVDCFRVDNKELRNYRRW